MTLTTQRQVVDNTIISSALPALKIKVDAEFTFIGVLRFSLKEIALVERFIFMDQQDSKTRRYFIVQFEGVFEGVDFTYQYGITNPIHLDRHAYSHSVWVYSNADSAREDPGAESDQTTRFLQDHGYEVVDGRAMSRFARIVDDDRRHEIIVFYEESLDLMGISMDDYEQLSPDRKLAFERELTERSLQSFQVTDIS